MSDITIECTPYSDTDTEFRKESKLYEILKRPDAPTEEQLKWTQTIIIIVLSLMVLVLCLLFLKGQISTKTLSTTISSRNEISK